jgi:hypothetical protein
MSPNPLIPEYVDAFRRMESFSRPTVNRFELTTEEDERSSREGGLVGASPRSNVSSPLAATPPLQSYSAFASMVATAELPHWMVLDPELHLIAKSAREAPVNSKEEPW